MYSPDQYIEEKRTINLRKMQLLSWVVAVVALIVYGSAFYSLADDPSANVFAGKSVAGIFWILLGFVGMIAAGICLHELVHGFFFAIFAKSGFKSIKFGVLTKPVFAFYCHCKEPLKRHQYMVSAIMPLILLGILPSVIAVFTSNFLLLLAGYILTVGAIGDVMMIKMLVQEDKNSYVLDHPSEIGFYVLKEKNVER